MATDFVLEMKGIRKSFFGTEVLKGVNFGVLPNEVHVLLGENGAGKSTLMKILSGFYQSDGGDIYINGDKVNLKDPVESKRMGIGMVYQELMLMPNLSVAENVWVGRLPAGKTGFVQWKTAKDETRKMFSQLGLDIDIEKKVDYYDLGIQQLIEITRVIYQDAKVIVLDEPTSSLTSKEVQLLFKVIKTIKEEKGVSFIYITHNLDEIYEIGDRVTVLRDGSTIGDTIEDVRAVPVDHIIERMVGRKLTEKYPKQHNATDEVVMDVEGLTDLDNAFSDISFDIRKGEVLGIAGLVGAGRSELANAIYGLRKVKSGEIRLRGEIYTPTNSNYAITQHIGLLTKDRKKGLLLNLSIAENISATMLKGFAKFGFRLKKKELQAADKYIELLRIDTDSAKKIVRNLSGGNQQKVAVARWNCNGTEIYLMDDPTRGVDVGAKVEIYRLINDITSAGAAVFMISSDMPELLGMSDRIMIMRSGRITAIANAEECTQEFILEKAAGGKM